MDLTAKPAHRYFEMCRASYDLDEALMAAFGAFEREPGDTDPDTWPCRSMGYDDYDESFELWGVKDNAWIPTPEQLQAAFALGFSRCWVCYPDGTECYYSPEHLTATRVKSHHGGTAEGKYLRAKLQKRIAELERQKFDTPSPSC